MKHNTHIYIAAKAIEFTTESVSNLLGPDGNLFTDDRAKKTKERIDAKNRQRILRYYDHLTIEAIWAPDDILRDNHPYHVFKLFAEDEFQDIPEKYKRKKYEHEGRTFYKYNGGLPYRIDHLANEIIDMCKLRDYNDQYSQKQIMYKYLLISHYITDAHVPMHCDHRDDPPEEDEIKLNGNYMKESAHSALEGLWEKAVTPVAREEGIIEPERARDMRDRTEYSEYVIFGMSDCSLGEKIKVPVIGKYELMDFIIGVCLLSKERCRKLFPLESPDERDDTIISNMTKDIFADAIGNLMAVWRYIWVMTNRPYDLA